MTCMRARASLNFELLGPLTAELAALERLKKNKHRLIIFSGVLDRILFILAGTDYISESLDDFEIPQDPITGFHGNR